MKFTRASGVLLHPTSLPGPDGIGDLGPECYRWIDFLAGSGCGLWQILPLGPTGYGDSPYQCFSAFAGNPYLISPALLLEDGLLNRTDLADRPVFPAERVDFGEVIPWKLKVLERAEKRFETAAPAALQADFEAFQVAQAFWLDDFALFMAIKENQHGVGWENWEPEFRLRQEEALAAFQSANGNAIRRQKLRQFLFFRQWRGVHDYAARQGITIIGDIPIFVAFDSADAWANPELFYMDKKRRLTAVAGVPPDYFSPTGQLWGNPLYKWEAHRKSGYAWWIQRFRAILEMVDIIRLDHFRGFAGYWEVPAGSATAEHGQWVPGPGKHFMAAIEQALGSLPIIAEDLGEITPDVIELRDSFNLPGMKILQFGFDGDATHAFLPHNYPQNCVAYTGTHDNDTVCGWYTSAPEVERDLCRRYLARSGNDIAWDMIRAIWSSVAVQALAPMQDLLSLGTEARMNFPGKTGGYWSWRLGAADLTPQLQARLLEMNTLYRRSTLLPEKPAA
ncbi:MAG TPA: 4-alpha-glucanotransferase [Anaerolineaceae bacterium]|jgi:4-alpha-glucanotransferase|nr:4-alpha-glucanotransferase [Anaerolineaceae bacterium]